MFVTLDGIVGAVVRAVHPKKQSCMFVTLDGMLGAVVRDVQYAKQWYTLVSAYVTPSCVTLD
jgi:hypothetical protein